jgi:hypothetical protein
METDMSETRPQQPPTTFDEWWEKYLRGHDESGYWEMPVAKAAWDAARAAPETGDMPPESAGTPLCHDCAHEAVLWLPRLLAAASAARQARPPQQGQPILRKVRLTYIGCQVWSAELLHDDGTSSEWRDYGRTRAEAIGMVLRRATEVVPLEIIEVDPAAAVGVGVPAAGTEVAK